MQMFNKLTSESRRSEGQKVRCSINLHTLLHDDNKINSKISFQTEAAVGHLQLFEKVRVQREAKNHRSQLKCVSEGFCSIVKNFKAP